MAALARCFSFMALHKTTRQASPCISSGSSTSTPFAPPKTSCSLRVSSGVASMESLGDCWFRAAARLSKDRGAWALFTGLVEDMGLMKEVRVLEDQGFEMTIEANVVLENVSLGYSIAVNGTHLLPVTRLDSSSFCVGFAPETLLKLSLGEIPLLTGSLGNLERSLLPSTHTPGRPFPPQGHVDGTGTIDTCHPENDSLRLTSKTSLEILKHGRAS